MEICNKGSVIRIDYLDIEISLDLFTLKFLLHHDQQIYEETHLITLLAEDSEYAFQLMYDRYRNRIYQTAIRYLKSPLLAQEVVQDVFLKLWIERKNIKIDQPLEAWLYTVAKNNLINRLKKIACEWKALSNLKLLTQQFVNNSSSKIEEAQYNELLHKAIITLPQQQQKVFCLARNEHLTYIQIGEKMGISPLTVKKHMSRALLHIKNHFSGIEDLFFAFILLNLSFFL
ncbi:MAG: RNA polymerase sigma-70 factor [Ginsengibacter sp.]